VVSEPKFITEARALASLSYCQPDNHKPPPWYTGFMWWKAVYDCVQLKFAFLSLSRPVTGGCFSRCFKKILRYS